MSHDPEFFPPPPKQPLPPAKQPTGPMPDQDQPPGEPHHLPDDPVAVPDEGDLLRLSRRTGAVSRPPPQASGLITTSWLAVGRNAGRTRVVQRIAASTARAKDVATASARGG